MHERWRGRGCMNGSLQLRFALSTHTRTKRHTHTFHFHHERTHLPPKAITFPRSDFLRCRKLRSTRRKKEALVSCCVCLPHWSCLSSVLPVFSLALCGFCGSVAFCGPLDCPPCGPWSLWKEMFPLLPSSPSSPSKPHAIPCPAIPLSDLVYPRRLLP